MDMMNLVWLRSDLRIYDNPALYNAVAQGPTIAVYCLSNNNITLNFKDDGNGRSIPVAYQIEANNVSDGPLFVTLLHLSADFGINLIDTNKILIAPNTNDCKENVLLLGDFFNPNPIKIIKTGTNK